MKFFKQFLTEIITKEGSEWAVKSKKGKSLGKYSTKEKALKRLRQIEYWKKVK